MTVANPAATPASTPSFLKTVLGVVSFFGACASILSVVLLIRHGFNHGFSAPLQLLLDHYEQFIAVALEPLAPYMREALSYIERFISIDLALHDHWQHIFVLMWVYFIGDFRLFWERGRYAFGVFSLVFGALVALASSLGGGAATIDDPRFLIVVFPAAGFAFYEAVKSPPSATFYRRAGDTWWQTCRYYLVAFALTNAAAGVVAYAAAVGFGRAQWPNPGLLGLFVFFALMIVRNVVLGFRYADINRVEGGSVRSRFLKSATGRLGVLLITIIVGAALFILSDAGLKLAGL